MGKRKSTKESNYLVLVLLSAFLLIVAGVVYLVFLRSRGGIGTIPDPSKAVEVVAIEEPEELVYLGVDFGNGETRNYAEGLESGDTPMSVVERVLLRNGMSMEDVDGGGEWTYWVNRLEQQDEASVYILNDGDLVEWRYLLN